MKKYSECTTILVGKQMTADGSMVVARSEDYNSIVCKNMTIYPDTEHGKKVFSAIDSPFKCDLPEKALEYTTLEGYDLPGHWGSAGFNSAFVGMSATESIFSNEKALKADPLVETGVGENSVFNIVLPYINSAKEGVERLGFLIEKYGVMEGFGIGFIDKDEIWYLETACGHRWLACKLPEDVYFVTGNQSRFRIYDAKDTENFMASKDLVEFAIKNNLYDPKKGKFDFHEAYSRDEKLDTTYNYPRVWGLQQLFTPSIKQDVQMNTFPVYAKADKKITIHDLRKAFRFHYQDTEHDPYKNNNPKEIFRPVSIFRTTQTHILTVRPQLPLELGEINYVCLGMATLGVFIPFYQGTDKYLDEYTKGNNECSDDSAYWKFRKVQALAMTNYNKYAPIVQETYAKWEKETDARQKEMEWEYMNIYKQQPMRAHDLIQEFAIKTMQSAMDTADALTNKLFTALTMDIQNEYEFHGA